MRRNITAMWLSIAGLMVASAVSAQTVQQKAPAPPAQDPAADLAPELKRFLDVFSTVTAKSADPVPTEKLLFEGAIPAMLRRLDPHTQFFEPAQFDQLKQMEQSEQKGFGSIVSVLPGQVIFLQTLPGTPSSKAGIQPGDEMVAINNVGIGNLEPEQILQLLTQARQQRIMVYLRRQGVDHLLQMPLTPEIEDAPTVDRSFLLGPGIGYVRITSWDVDTAAQFKKAIEALNQPPLQALLIDLRNNPGGVVKAALDGASFFLQPGQRILTAKGRTGTVESADVPKNAQPYKFRLAVLIDEKTASASEIFSGALQDHDRAVIVGEASYGKGLVQSVLPLSEGAGLAITTAFYYTPSGRSIQRPLQNSALSATFGSHSSDAALKYRTDSGRTVTGGGGIQPDVQVGPAARTRLETVVDGSGVMTAFATDYLAHHSPLPASFAVTPAILDELKVFLAQRRIQPSTGEWSEERQWISDRLTEELITQARGVAAGDQIAARRDPQIQAALTAVNDRSLLAARTQ